MRRPLIDTVLLLPYCLQYNKTIAVASDAVSFLSFVSTTFSNMCHMASFGILVKTD